MNAQRIAQEIALLTKECNLPGCAAYSSVLLFSNPMVCGLLLWASSGLFLVAWVWPECAPQGCLESLFLSVILLKGDVKPFKVGLSWV